MLERARRLFPRLQHWRRTIHMYPELGFQEKRTAALVAEVLAEFGLRVTTGVAGTGVVADLGRGENLVALRADMDALPIQELNDVPYASQVPGVMHACGHDVHTACLLGAAAILKDTEFDGRVRFIFQPAEEGQDGGGPSGANRMIQEGVMEGVDAIFALHVEPDLPVGVIDCVDGPIMAASDRFAIKVLGKACHGAYAYKGVDAILLGSYVVQAVNHIISRNIPASESGVISLGTIQGGTKSNIIPGEVELSGTIRTFKAETREYLFHKLEEACGLTRCFGGDYELKIFPGYPITENDPQLAALVREVGDDLLDKRTTERSDHYSPREMGSEDFSFFALHAPGAYFRLGTGSPGEPPRAGHNPFFDVNEDALPIGAAMLAEIARRYLSCHRD